MTTSGRSNSILPPGGRRIAGPSRRWRGCWLAAVVVALCTQAQARPRVRKAPPRKPPPAVGLGVLSTAREEAIREWRSRLEPEQGESRSLRERLGVVRAEELLLSAELDERLRGIERLASSGTDEAVDRLVEALAPGSAVRVNPRTRLEAVRALARYARQDDVRSALVSVLNSARAGAAELPLETLARETAALALARAGGRKCLAPLVAAVVAGGRSGDTARRAIIAHPPRKIRALIGNSKRLSPRMMSLLGELGDVRAIGVLRRQLKSKQVRVRAAAALALARLGDESVEGHVRGWLEPSPKTKLVRPAAVEVLVTLGAAGAHQGIAKLLAETGTRRGALELALRAPSPQLVPALRALAEKDTEPVERQHAVAALVRAGGPKAAEALVALLRRPETATQAALGLASMPGAAATAGLERALRGASAGPARRLVLRAAVVRFFKHRALVPGLIPALEQALAAKLPADRAVGSFGLALVGQRTVAELSQSSDEAVAAAAARAALAVGPAALRDCSTALREESRRLASAPPSALDPARLPPLSAVACGAALAAGLTDISPAALAFWAEQGGALAPLAAMELAKRDSLPYRSRLRSLLGGTDPLVRAHVAFGLAQSPEADSVALLVRAYRFEAAPAVRRAIVRALSRRPESLRQATLRLARDLDPDAGVRALARSALRGQPLTPLITAAGSEVAWITMQANLPVTRERAEPRAAVLVRGDGLCLPAVTAPDGVLLVAGLSRLGEVSVQLAAPRPSREPED